MREIKFRAWDKIRKRWLSPYSIITDCMGNIYWLNSEGEYHRKGCVTIMQDIELSQYTGLKDKHGKEIYEGDIIELLCHEKCSGIKAQVKYWNAGWWFFTNEDTKGMMYEICRTALNDNNGNACKVIGNIYENPELLKKP